MSCRVQVLSEGLELELKRAPPYLSWTDLLWPWVVYFQLQHLESSLAQLES